MPTLATLHTAQGIARILETASTIMSPLLITIAGGTCAGKTTFASALARNVNIGVPVLPLDAYFRDHNDPDLPRDAGRPIFDSPGAYHAAAFVEDVRALLAGRNVWRPDYDIATNQRILSRTLVRAGPIVIAEGLFAIDFLHGISPQLAVYVEASGELRLARRTSRDTMAFGVPADAVARYYSARGAPCHDRHVAPQRASADLIISTEGDSS